ncbi:MULTISPECIES: ATP-binding protein [unclassified Acinetobacter]|uniref:ATP-binding protein n=1 Tax=unclassified Acinetobacter TaxID=196816 RepID=UPI00190E1146|nr:MULTISPECIES: ATP-binding protein [unclassified Acinetobacter]MBK0065046.1 ATP-binding protein [Acinetobacter sp. S55]MBK0065294.1 ATP-binding protein [Acinetobacter sp. S54]
MALEQLTAELIQTVKQLNDQLQSIAQALRQFGPQAIVDDQLFEQAIAFRWEKTEDLRYKGCLVPIRHPQLSSFNALSNIDLQVNKVKDNTEAFVKGYFANNVLLTGARGTGKSSIVKACLNEFHAKGLRIIELEKKDLNDLPKIVNLIADRPERFIIFCDDLAFEAGDTSYSGLKTVLDGSLSASADNVLIYATSNRKHMVTEYQRDNQEFFASESGEIHPGDSVEQKVSLADRFGLQIHFYSFSQVEYLNTVKLWLVKYGWQHDEIEHVKQQAIQYATQKGNRSGRIANQFAKMLSGQRALQQDR